jgi:hypothetical protein
MSGAAGAASDGDYIGAVELYRSALEIRPGDGAAARSLADAQKKAIRDNISEVQALLYDGQYDKAYRAGGKLPIEDGDDAYDWHAGYLSSLKTRPQIESIDPTYFPVVSVTVAYAGGGAFEGAPLSVSEDGAQAQIISADIANGTARIAFAARDTDSEFENREIAVSIHTDDLEIPAYGSYATPKFADAAITLVTTDISEYPTVKAYFKVENQGTGERVRNLLASSFEISESVSGGEYLAREVKSAKSLLDSGEADTDAGVNIDLIADKSDSISPSDMAKIKQVMAQFADGLQYKQGDKAEVLAFDSIVQQMCTYTNNAALLKNGISNMATDGMTAFYDAVYTGIHNAALQGGARCVIAFTDGHDNSSHRTAEDVVSFANARQVPLFIIGVGDVDRNILRPMAERTNGRYWDIDDLYDLQVIYNTIYDELKELYVVEYVSDPSSDAYAARSLGVKISGGGYKGECDAAFTPSKTAPDRQGAGGSRYEIYVEDVSWEEANMRCLEMGGHLVTITSQAEEDEIVTLVGTTDAAYIWLGGYTSYDGYGNVFAHWITGENFSYSVWSDGEPSRTDRDGTPEWYLMLWNPVALGGWSWNDQRNDPLADFKYFAGKLAYVCEFEQGGAD